ncbi:hypothetical protein P7C70_g6389, partial [Phenoliferia sp. Uapishka_3]
MPDRPSKGKGRAVSLITGPDDPEGILIREDPARRRPGSRVSTSSTPFAFTTLEPILSTQQIFTLPPRPEVDTQKNLFQNNAGRMRDDPIEFGKFVTSYATGSGWRSYSDYIGPRVMYEGYSAKCIKDLLESAPVTKKVRELSEARLHALNLPPEVDREKKLADLEAQLNDVTRDIAVHLCATMDSSRREQHSCTHVQPRHTHFPTRIHRRKFRSILLLLGNPKEKESLTGLLLNTRVIQLKLGRIDVRFQKPFSLKGFIAEQTARTVELRESTPGPPRNTKKDQDVLLRRLGYQVLSDINKVAVIMPAALIGSIMLTIRGRGVGRSELIKRVGWLRAAIEARGGRVAEFANTETEQVVDRALVVLKDVIGEHRDLIEPTFFAISRFELSFYRNQIMHLFVSEAMLAATLYTHVKAGGAAPSQRMKRRDVLDQLSFLSRLLQNEFVYGTQGLEANANATIASLERDGVVLIEDELIGLSPLERATGRENFDFYCFLLWPFIEVYWLGAVSLFSLTPIGNPPSADATVAWVAEKQFQKNAQLLGKNLFYQGDVSYLEAVNQATLSNAFLRMVESGVILTRKSTSPKHKGLPLMALHPSWVPRRLPSGDIAPTGRLWGFLEQLGAFRREGKNRRDNSTGRPRFLPDFKAKLSDTFANLAPVVSSRVFKHCSAIAPPILEWTPFTGVESVDNEFWAVKANL